MIDTLVKAGNKVNTILPGRPAPVADIDFFIRPPPWGGGRSKRKIAYFYWEATPFPCKSTYVHYPYGAGGTRFAPRGAFAHRANAQPTGDHPAPAP